MNIRVPIRVSGITALALGIALSITSIESLADSGDRVFNRVATFPVYLNTDIDAETVAETVDVSSNGKTLVYTDTRAVSSGLSVSAIQPNPGRLVLSMLMVSQHRLR
jgi:hypothetical protein